MGLTAYYLSTLASLATEFCGYRIEFPMLPVDVKSRENDLLFVEMIPFVLDV